MNQTVQATIEPTMSLASASDYFALLKPRVMTLVVFTALVGAYLAPGTLHPFLFCVAILCIAVGAGASGAINMWYERDIDALMDRTKNRPIPAGKIAPDDALAFGVVLAVGSVITIGLATNYLTAGLLAFTIFFYVFIYTIGLKRRTPQNIVIGGAAGAFPPVIGWTAVTGSLSLEPWLLFAIIFLWTPPHFWALSLFKCDEFTKARIPMLPVVNGIASTKRQIVLYSFVLGGVSLIPYFVGMLGLFYLGSAVVLGAIFLGISFQVWHSTDTAPSFRLFKFSIAYLFLLYLAMCLDHMYKIFI